MDLKTVTRLFVILLGPVIIWFPYFSPPSTIGPAGILRLDQVILPLIILILIIQREDLEIMIEESTKYLIITVLAIFGSIIVGAFWFGFDTNINHFFEIVIWLVYLLSLVTIPRVVNRETIKKSIPLIILFSALASLFVVLQILNFHNVNQHISPLFTYERHLNVLGRRATGPTLSSNVLPQLLLLPFLLVYALLIRNLAILRRGMSLNDVVFGFSGLLIFTGIFLSYSRSGLVFTILAVTAVSVLILYDTKPSTKALSKIVFMMMLLTFITVLVFGPGRHSFLASITEAHTFQRRIQIWHETVPLIFESPIIGQGTTDTLLHQLGYSTHDSGIFNFWYRYGLVGTLSFVLFLISVARYSGNIVTKSDFQKYRPFEWAVSCAVFGWSLALFPPWLFVNVAQARRSFSLFLLFIIFLYSIQTSANSDENE